MTALDIFNRYFNQRWNYDLVAKKYKEKGSKIVGYPDVNAPEEIIMAAGCLPLLITGNWEANTKIAKKYMEFPISLPVRYLYEAILGGQYDFLDLICIPGGNKWLKTMYGCLEQEKELTPSLKFSQTYYLERLVTNFKLHRDYNLDRLLAFKEYLENFTGKKITYEALGEAIKTTNETRRLLKCISELRKENPPRISGCEALPIIMASMFIPKKEYNKLVKTFLDTELNSLPKKDSSKARVFVSGSAIDNLQLYELIENEQAIVVGEDTEFGDRYKDMLIDEELDPMEAICDRYTYKPPDHWMLGRERLLTYRTNAVEEAKAQGEIFFHIEMDNDAAWDYPEQKDLLEKRFIPILALEPQQYKLIEISKTINLIKEFVDTISKRVNG